MAREVSGRRCRFIPRLSFLLWLCATGCSAESRSKRRSIKTLKIENGDVIDCIDIYSQPSFAHPLLNNHTLMMQPDSVHTRKRNVLFSSSSEGLKAEVSAVGGGSQVCPRRSIPILTAKQTGQGSDDDDDDDDHAPPPGSGKTGLLRAFLEVEGRFHGAAGYLTVWRPGVSLPEEFSCVKLSLIAGRDDGVEPEKGTFNSIQAGWMVNKKLYGDYRPRIFVYWTRDGFLYTGCYNLLCPGFVQVSRATYLGAELTPSSIYGGESQALPVEIFKDSSKSWWLRMNGVYVGYWPSAIFTSLAAMATRIQWGAEVYNVMPHGVISITEMGNGHFPWEGGGGSAATAAAATPCSLYGLQVINMEEEYEDPADAISSADRPACYDSSPMQRSQALGCYTLVGGPGPGRLIPGCIY